MDNNSIVASCRNGSAMKVSRLAGRLFGRRAGARRWDNGFGRPRAQLSLISVYKALLHRNLEELMMFIVNIYLILDNLNYDNDIS